MTEIEKMSQPFAFLKFLTHIAHIVKAPRANAETKALSKSAILPILKGITEIPLTFEKKKYANDTFKEYKEINDNEIHHA